MSLNSFSEISPPEKLYNMLTNSLLFALIEYPFLLRNNLGTTKAVRLFPSLKG